MFASAEFLGFGSPEELKETDVREHYVDPERREELLEQLQSAGQVGEFTVRLRRADGAIRFCRAGAPATGKEGHAVLVDVGRRVAV